MLQNPISTTNAFEHANSVLVLGGNRGTVPPVSLGGAAAIAAAIVVRFLEVVGIIVA
jgi:hypothetical protein